MKILFFSIVFIGLSMSGCATYNEKSYDRSNNASEKALEGLERDTK